MPLEIRELVIKTTVSNQTGSTGDTGSAGKMKEANINEIVDKVFEILKEKSER
ncbi:DUF5908 family protein [Aquimarina gracilis]|uniref:DUF5908 family protein n=1 Tax=Aquimarina gracilis TaxID=874422 RepID=A0ABU5ZTK6_9FLAO|nr:DUF5908 family protein [Aquimarina gracilis]MEB3345401.1 DUF5908 family protein [Aquimarina gracilis]